MLCALHVPHIMCPSEPASLQLTLSRSSFSGSLPVSSINSLEFIVRTLLCVEYLGQLRNMLGMYLLLGLGLLDMDYLCSGVAKL